MVQSLRLKATVLAVLVLLLIAVYLANLQLKGALYQFGLIPRYPAGWYHILTAPFIHDGVGHLLNNLFVLVVFSALCLLRSVRFYLASSAFIIIVSGLLVWVFGRPATHIGASGWVLGLWSLCIAIAWFDRRLNNILLALAVIFFYGGMVYGILPTDPRVSFEMHLGGVIAGVLCAFLYGTFNKHVGNNTKRARR